jgi:hypothetical protein
VAPCNVLSLLHLPDQQRVVCGCEDGTIRLHTLDGRMPPAGASSCGGLQQPSQPAHDPGSGLLPTVWTGTHPCMASNSVLLFGSHIPPSINLYINQPNKMRVSLMQQ